MSPEGMSRQAYLTAKFGHAASAVYGRIAMAGLDAGIDFQFSKIQRTPDTRPIHQLLLAAGPDSEALANGFYQAYFWTDVILAIRGSGTSCLRPAG